MSEKVVPFTIAVPEAELVDLRRRLASARWPDAGTAPGWSQGAPLPLVRDLCHYWQTAYDWRATEERLNRWPQYRTSVDGLPVHFVHAGSTAADAVPVILTHGWPGSFVEFEGVLERLTAAAAGGGPGLSVVVPSLPGYGFSGRPSTPGWDVHRIGRAWVELMDRLGYRQFVAAGSDWGTSVSTSIALHAPERLLGLLLVPPLVPEALAPGEVPTLAEQRAAAELAERSRTSSAYSAVQASRPQTLGYGLVDSPVGLCAWLLEKIWSWADHDGDLYAVLDRNTVLDDISLYWFTGTGASAARLYWESIAEVSAWFSGAVVDSVPVPTGAIVFPREVPRPSRRQAERRFPHIVHWAEPERGGHFGAWEQPDRFTAELQAVVQALLASPRSASATSAPATSGPR